MPFPSLNAHVFRGVAAKVVYPHSGLGGVAQFLTVRKNPAGVIAVVIAVPPNEARRRDRVSLLDFFPTLPQSRWLANMREPAWISTIERSSVLNGVGYHAFSGFDQGVAFRAVQIPSLTHSNAQLDQIVGKGIGMRYAYLARYSASIEQLADAARLRFRLMSSHWGFDHDITGHRTGIDLLPTEFDDAYLQCMAEYRESDLFKEWRRKDTGLDWDRKAELWRPLEYAAAAAQFADRISSFSDPARLSIPKDSFTASIKVETSRSYVLPAHNQIFVDRFPELREAVPEGMWQRAVLFNNHWHETADYELSVFKALVTEQATDLLDRVRFPLRICRAVERQLAPQLVDVGRTLEQVA